jgi:hypothetical protein
MLFVSCGSNSNQVVYDEYCIYGKKYSDIKDSVIDALFRCTTSAKNVKEKINNGTLEGYVDDKLLYKIPYKNNKRIAGTATFFRINGTLGYEQKYIDGSKNEVIIYNTNGSKKFEARFEYTNNKLVKSTHYFLNYNKRSGKKEEKIYENGIIKSITKYYLDKKIFEELFDNTGKSISENYFDK